MSVCVYIFLIGINVSDYAFLREPSVASFLIVVFLFCFFASSNLSVGFMYVECTLSLKIFNAEKPVLLWVTCANISGNFLSIVEKCLINSCERNRTRKL